MFNKAIELDLKDEKDKAIWAELAKFMKLYDYEEFSKEMISTCEQRAGEVRSRRGGTELY